MSVGEPTPNPSQEGMAVRPPRCQMYSKHFEKWYLIPFSVIVARQALQTLCHPHRHWVQNCRGTHLQTLPGGGIFRPDNKEYNRSLIFRCYPKPRKFPKVNSC
jgi:hypothetical protein